METRKRITLDEDYGDAKKGSVFVRGDLSYGVPEYYEARGQTDAKMWYWKQGTEKRENKFLHANSLKLK